ncbi:hypothetical protein KH201010_12080 [Edwardsiella ictaluri]|nr:hypothetical protein KH201010_12080 [Edwardsiella ictaluri]
MYRLSTGSMGDAYDNAMAESINGLYKAEMIHRQRGKTLQRQSGPHWRGRTGTTIVGYWNGSVISPPAEAETAYYAAIGNSVMAA